MGASQSKSKVKKSSNKMSISEIRRMNKEYQISLENFIDQSELSQAEVSSFFSFMDN